MLTALCTTGKAVGVCRGLGGCAVAHHLRMPSWQEELAAALCDQRRLLEEERVVALGKLGAEALLLERQHQTALQQLGDTHAALAKVQLQRAEQAELQELQAPQEQAEQVSAACSSQAWASPPELHSPCSWVLGCLLWAQLHWEQNPLRLTGVGGSVGWGGLPASSLWSLESSGWPPGVSDLADGHKRGRWDCCPRQESTQAHGRHGSGVSGQGAGVCWADSAGAGGTWSLGVIGRSRLLCCCVGAVSVRVWRVVDELHRVVATSTQQDGVLEVCTQRGVFRHTSM